MVSTKWQHVCNCSVSELGFEVFTATHLEEKEVVHRVSSANLASFSTCENLQ